MGSSFIPSTGGPVAPLVTTEVVADAATDTSPGSPEKDSDTEYCHPVGQNDHLVQVMSQSMHGPSHERIGHSFALVENYCLCKQITEKDEKVKKAKR